MTDLFVALFNGSIAAGWLVLALVVLRPLLKKAPRWICVALWGLVAVRLLCPFSLESALSLIPSAQVISPDIMTDPTPTIHTGIQAVNNTVNPVLQEHFAPQVGASVNPLQILLPIYAFVWAAGVVGMAVYALVSWLRLRNRVKTAVRLQKNVYQSEWTLSPFVLGLLKPRIYLPFAIPEGDMEHILAHERAHIRRKDHWWKPMGFALLALHWFHPLMWLAYILLCRDIEVACDEKVIRQMDTQQRADYSQTMLRSSADRRSIAACPLAFGEVGVKARIKNVISYKKPAFWIVVIAMILCIILAVCFLTNPVIQKQQNLYTAGDLVAQNGLLSYMPENGKEIYPEIYLSTEGLQVYDSRNGVSSFLYMQAESMNRAQMVQRFADIFTSTGIPILAPSDQRETIPGEVEPPAAVTFTSIVHKNQEGNVETLLPEEAVPQCEQVTICTYRENAFDEEPRYTVFFFDGEPKWIMGDDTRIYELLLVEGAQGNTPQSKYVGGELVMMHGGLSFVPENGSNYEDIQFSEEGLSLYIHYDGERSFPYVQTETVSREELVQRVEEGLFMSFRLNGYPATPNPDSVVPQCDSVTIYMYRENETDEHPAYSVYFFDGEPKWFAERRDTRIYDLQPLPYSPDHMTLADVKELAKVDGQITWEHVSDCVSVVYGSGIVRADFPIDAAYKLQFYAVGGGKLSGNGELICIPTGDRVDIRTGDLDAFLEENRIQARDALISNAIAQRYAAEESDGKIHVESHMLLGQNTYTEIDTVYMLVLRRVYSVEGGQLREEYESLMPAALTFSVDSAGQYRLTEYWEPRDGSYYEEDVKHKFPEHSYFATMNSQQYLSDLQEECEKKAKTALAEGEW